MSNQENPTVDALVETFVQLTSMHRRAAEELQKLYVQLREHGLLSEMRMVTNTVTIGTQRQLMEAAILHQHLTGQVGGKSDKLEEIGNSADHAMKALLGQPGAAPLNPVASAVTSLEEAVEAEAAPLPPVLALIKEEHRDPEEPAPVAEEEVAMPTKVLSTSTATHNYIGQVLFDILKKYLSSQLLEQGEGTMGIEQFDQYNEDLTMLSAKQFAKWPTGLYMNRKDRSFQLLLSMNVPDNPTNVVAVVPVLYKLADTFTDVATEKHAFFLYSPTPSEVRVVNDDIPPLVRDALILHLSALVEAYLKKQS